MNQQLFLLQCWLSEPQKGTPIRFGVTLVGQLKKTMTRDHTTAIEHDSLMDSYQKPASLFCFIRPCL